MRKLLWILLLVFTGFIGLHAQVQKVKLNSITIEGNNTADASMIRLNSGLVAGTEVSGEDLQKAVKNLWALGIFSDIKLYVTGQGLDGLDLLVRVKEYPRMSELTIRGSDELSEDEVEDALNVYRGMRLSQHKIFRMRKALLDKYHEEGYLLAEVEFDTVSVG